MELVLSISFGLWYIFTALFYGYITRLEKK